MTRKEPNTIEPAGLVYLDNAATSFPKPEPAIQAVEKFLRSCGNPSRGSHDLSIAAANAIFDAREKLSALLGIKKSERLIFTPGCTYSINMVIKGLAASGKLEKGDRILLTAFEHNAVTRAIEQLNRFLPIEIVTLESRAKSEPEVIEELDRIFAKGKLKLAFLSAASNVTGSILVGDAMLAILKEHSVIVALDAAQTAGKLPYNLTKSPIDFWCASGHKGLLGPPGIGLLYAKEGSDLEPLVCGGTGSSSQSLYMPDVYPDRLEPGTPAGHSIAGLAAAADWLLEQGQENILAHELELTERFLSWSANRPQLKVFGESARFLHSQINSSANPWQEIAHAPSRMPVISFKADSIPAGELADILNNEFHIAARAGLHCAGTAHRALGTEVEGLLRISFGPFNTDKDLDSLTAALDQILKVD